jgi:DNA-binding NtrC family response regulator
MVVLMTAYATVPSAVAAMKEGAQDYLVKPFDPEELTLLVRRLAAQQALVRENVILRRELAGRGSFGDFVTRSEKTRAAVELARTAAKSGATILILGESGTGKEVLARAIHAESPRRGGPFVPVSCAALTETLLESELFGYERGAFTGAVARQKGKIEAAARGTLFLDEIGDVSAKLQMDLLRVLEDRRFYRLGGTERVVADVRVVAATNRDLARAMQAGTFREDLFYRLNVITVTLPPLRERREDVPALAASLLETLAAEAGRLVPSLAPDALAALTAHDWPGNVRELRNVLERALVVSAAPVLHAADLALDAASRPAAPAGDTLEDVERRHVVDTLERLDGNVTRAARRLGIDRATLYHKIHKWGLRDRGDSRHPAEERDGPSAPRDKADPVTR